MEFDFVVKINKDESEQYIGNINNGIKEGYGKMEYWTSRIETGNFKDNMKHGYFEEYFDKHKTFEGNYHNGKRKGYGKEYIRDKLYYEGEYLNDRRHGKGKQYDLNTGIINFEGEYRNQYIYDGVLKSDDYNEIHIDYSECTEEEQNELVEHILGWYNITIEYFDENKINELVNLIGKKQANKGDILLLINKFIENDYNKEGIIGDIVGFMFQEDNTIEVTRYTPNIEITEYAKGHYLQESRFEAFEICFLDDITEKSLINIKEIYFRNHKIVEFINKFISQYGEKVFDSLYNIQKYWIYIITYLSEECNCDIYEDFFETYLPNEIMYSDIKCAKIKRYCVQLCGNCKEYIDKEYLMYFQVIENMYKFESKGEAILTAWLLFYYKGVEYYSNKFFNEYKKEFSDIINLNLEDCINIFINYNSKVEDKFEKVKFTCFLMDKRKLLETVMWRGKELKHINFNIMHTYCDVNKMIKEEIEKREIEKKEKREIAEFEKQIMNLSLDI